MGGGERGEGEEEQDMTHASHNGGFKGGERKEREMLGVFFTETRACHVTDNRRRSRTKGETAMAHLHAEYHTTEFIRRCIEAPFIPQRSAEWFRMRQTRITGSMCDTLLGTNRFSSWDQVVCEKSGMPVEFKGNAATEHGIQNEEIAIRLYEAQTGRKVFELGLTEHPTIDILAHSPDGISLKKKTDNRTDVSEQPILLEVKCPYTREIKKGKVPAYYMGQLQLGLFVFGLKEAHFVQYKPSPYVLDITVVQRDDTWLERHMPTFTAFWQEVEYWKKIGWRRHPYYQRTCRNEVFSICNGVDLEKLCDTPQCPA